MDFTPNIAEIWPLYTIGTIMIACRIACRVKLVGLAGFHRDDYLVFLVWAAYTTVTVVAHVFILKAGGMHTSLLTPEQRAAMPESEYAAWEYGSQIFLVGLTCYFVIVWLLKFNMLFFYHRIVQGLWSEKFIRPVMYFVAGCGVAIILTLTLMCRPFKKLWQVYPDPGCEFGYVESWIWRSGADRDVLFSNSELRPAKRNHLLHDAGVQPRHRLMYPAHPAARRHGHPKDVHLAQARPLLSL
jgi:hypothetical protein